MRMSSAPCTAASALATSVLPTPASPSISSGRFRIIHHPERGREFAIRDIADFGEASRDGFAGDWIGHARSARRRGGSDLDIAVRVMPGLVPGAHAVTRHVDCRISTLLIAAVGAIVSNLICASHGDGRDKPADASANFNYACSPSFSAASQVRYASCGIAICVEPRNLNASLTALAKHGTEPTFGLSPTPLAPIG